MSEFMDWHKRATAVSTALYAEGDRRRLGAYSGFLYGVDSALTWASGQEPSAAEVEAAARVIVFQFDYGQRQWDDASEQARSQALYEARDALRAAQKVRAGRDE